MFDQRQRYSLLRRSFIFRPHEARQTRFSWFSEWIQAILQRSLRTFAEKMQDGAAHFQKVC